MKKEIENKLEKLKKKEAENVSPIGQSILFSLLCTKLHG